jgi:hypothetical protein
MMGKSLIHVKQAAALTIVSAASPPKTVTEGILDLLAVPVGPAQSPEDRKRVLRLYAEAVEGYPIGVVERVLKDLRFNNPRNPFPATPQDVRERCVSAVRTWTRRVEAFYFGRDSMVPEVSAFDANGRARTQNERNAIARKMRQELHGKWEADAGDRVLALLNRGGDVEHFGPEPMKPGCVLPDTMVLAIVRGAIETKWSIIIEMSQENFDRIPVEAFADGIRDKALKDRQLRAYIDSLDPAVRRMRQSVIDRYKYCPDQIATEEAIMAKVREEIEESEREYESRVNKHGRWVEAPAEEAF